MISSRVNQCDAYQKNCYYEHVEESTFSILKTTFGTFIRETFSKSSREAGDDINVEEEH